MPLTPTTASNVEAKTQLSGFTSICSIWMSTTDQTGTVFYLFNLFELHKSRVLDLMKL